ncbi:hypothetical protein LTR74_009705 [Friedmanniomyces endolithicus]|nr:hypothetical protein LTR74_009705 [Friedmanniomyces endolithicus]
MTLAPDAVRDDEDVVSMLGIDDPGLDWPRKALSQAELTAEEGGARYLRLPRFGDALSVEEGLRRELRDDGSKSSVRSKTAEEADRVAKGFPRYGAGVAMAKPMCELEEVEMLLGVWFGVCY